MPKFTTSDGLSLYYTDQGTGQPLLCLAGLTRNSDDFSFVAPHLRDLRLICLDSRGRGQSDYDPTHTNYNILREGTDALELLDHLGLDQVTILGTSRGGLISMALAVGHRERLRGVILNDIGPVIDTSGLDRIMDYVGREPAAADFDAAAAALKHVYDADFPGVPLSRWRESAGHMFYEKPGGGLGIRYDKHLRDALLEQGENASPPDLWDWFEALSELPVGVIHGANSDLLSTETLAEMARRHPSLIYATVPDRAHVPFLDEPEALGVITRVLEQTV